MKPTRQKSVGILLIAALCLLSAQSIVAQPFPSCPEGTTLLAKFEWRGNQYVFEKPEGNEDVVTIIKGTTSKIKFTSTQFIGQVILYGGRDVKVVEINDTEGKVTNEGMENRGGQTPDISNVQFCGVVDPCPFVGPPTVSYDVVKENGDFFVEVVVIGEVALESVDIVTDGDLVLVDFDERFEDGIAEYRYRIANIFIDHQIRVFALDECGFECPVGDDPAPVVNEFPKRSGDDTLDIDFADLNGIQSIQFFNLVRTSLQQPLENYFTPGDTEVTVVLDVDTDDVPPGGTLFAWGVLAANACHATIIDPLHELAGEASAQISNIAGQNGNAEVGLEVPAELQLGQNYPNPFNPMTSIAFGLPEAGQVTLTVYDLLGREVAVLVDGVREAGSHQVMFEAGHLSGGTYIYRLTAGGTSITKKLLLLK